MSKARTLASIVSTGNVLVDGNVVASKVSGLAAVATSGSYTDLINEPTAPSGTIVGTTDSQTLTNKTIAFGSNTLTGVQSTLVSGTSIKTVNGASLLGSGDIIIGGSSYTVRSSNYTATSGDNILADTSGGSFTVTLPLSPATGTTVAVVDSRNSFGKNALTIGRNGQTIMGLAENMIVSNSGVSFGLVYNGSDWRIF